MSRESYRTRQKELILDYLKVNSGKHIKVQDIYEELKKTGSTIGISTIYRYLDRLVEEKKIRKYLLDGNAAACYQYGEDNAGNSHEYHLRCSKCGGLFHFYSSEISGLSRDIRNKGLNVNFENTVFSGECDTCNNNLDKTINKEMTK